MADLNLRHAVLRLCALTLVAASAVGCGSRAAESETTASLRRHSLRILVGLSAGGGHDLYARMMAPYLGRHVSGHPTVVVENMPGAGGLIAVNYLAHQARSDGSTIGLIAAQGVVAQMLTDPGRQFDVRTFGVIGSPAADAALCVMSVASRIDLAAWRERRARPLRLGATNYGSISHLNASLLAAALDLPFRLVVGYKGTSDIRAAMESGEVDGACVGLDGYLASFEPKANYSVVLQAAGSNIQELENVPSASRLVRDNRGRELLEVLSLVGTVSRFYVVPPGTPSGVTELLRRAFDETMHDEEFLRAAKSADLTIRALSAAAIEKSLAELLNLRADVRQRVIALLKSKAS